MTYTRPELDWVEAEWAYHLHGRSAFLSREDFSQLQVWDGDGVPADLIVGAMEAYFTRRAARPRPRSFIALSHLVRDVAKAMKARAALVRAGEAPLAAGWDAVKEPLGADPRARAAFEAWQALRLSAPGPDSPGFLDHFDAERQAQRVLLGLAEGHLGPRREALEQELRQRLSESKVAEGSLVWNRAWAHHWARLVAEAWGIPT
jgi:hypothetical protein